MSKPAAGIGLGAGLARPALRPVALAEQIGASFTGRAGGISGGQFSMLNLSADVGDEQRDVAANRAIVLEALGPGIAALAWMRQVHGADVVHLTDGAMACEQPPTADAMVTSLPAVALGVLVADCAPVLACDPRAGVIGVAHAGRAGLAAGVVPALVEAMCLAGASARRMRAVIGPAICGQCYEVPAQLRAEVADAVPAAGCLTRRGTPGIDLRAGVSAQLCALGVGEVRHDARCTAESAELYSYRRDGQTGRFAGLIWLVPGAITRRP